MKNYKFLLIILALILGAGVVSCSTNNHEHRYGEEWFSDNEYHWHECEDCHEIGDKNSHVFGEWTVISNPTLSEEGRKSRTCSICGHVEEETIDELNFYTITIVDSNEQELRKVVTNKAGEYVLPVIDQDTDKYFTGYYLNDQLFNISGVIDKDVIVKYCLSDNPFVANNLQEFKSAVDYGFDYVCVGDSFEIDETLYINSNLTITAKNDVVLKRSENFTGDLFVIGESREGLLSTVYQDESVTLTIDPEPGKTITIDGNKENVILQNEAIEGTVFFVTGLSTLNLSEGVNVNNNLKNDNSRTLKYSEEDGEIAKYLKYPTKVGGSAIINLYSTVNLNGANFKNNEVNNSNLPTVSNDLSSQGGVIYSFGETNINGGTFSNNKATTGAVIYSYKETNITKGNFEDNLSYNYGVIYLPGSQYSECHVIPESKGDVVFDNNVSQSSGGVFFVTNDASLHLEKTILSNNYAEKYGGAISGKGNMVINECEFIANESGSKGGAIYMYYKDDTEEELVRTCEISNSLFRKNSGPLGAALAAGNETIESSYTKCVNIELNNTIFEENHAVLNASAKYGHGGAIYAQKKASVLIDSSSFINNDAVGNGGAIYATDYANLNICDNSAFENNSAKNGGSVYVVDGAVVKATEVTFESNSASNNGGAIYIYTNAEFNGTNINLTSNVASNFGGGLYISGQGLVKFNNVISEANLAEVTGGFVYITTSGSNIYIYSGESKGCSASTANSENIYSNTKKAIVNIKGTDSKEYFDYDGVLISGKDGAYTLNDIL